MHNGKVNGYVCAARLRGLLLQWVSGLFRGVLYGATRGVMTGKKGNKNFYKGTFTFD